MLSWVVSIGYTFSAAREPQLTKVEARRRAGFSGESENAGYVTEVTDYTNSEIEQLTSFISGGMVAAKRSRGEQP